MTSASRSELLEELFTFHGVNISISSDSPWILGVLHNTLRHFPSVDGAEPDISFTYKFAPDIESHWVQRPDGRERVVYEPLLGQLAMIEDKLYMNYGERGRLLCDPERGRVDVSILESEADDEWLVTHPMFLPAFHELLKRRGLYSLHASALSVGGNGVLFPGTSGSGKSTMAIGLMKEGFDFLGDDTVFLAGSDEGLDVLAFPDVIDFTDRTAELFPELGRADSTPRNPITHKRQARAEEVFNVGFTPKCRPKLLVFPRVSGNSRSVLEPMDKDDALEEQAPNVLLTEASSSQKHLDVLAELVKSTDTYRLETGTDFAYLADLLRDMLARPQPRPDSRQE